MEEIVGLRFFPTDEQILNHYLKNKILGSHDISIRSVNEVDLLKFEPWDLRWQAARQKEDEDWYFFWSPERFGNGDYNRKRTRDGEHCQGSIKRSTAAGFWKKTGKDSEIVARNGGEVIGVKRFLVFHLRNLDSKAVKTNWVMHEYDLIKIPVNKKRFVFIRLKRNLDDKSTSPYDDGSIQHLTSFYEKDDHTIAGPEVETPILVELKTGNRGIMITQGVLPTRQPPNLPEEDSSNVICTPMPDKDQTNNHNLASDYGYFVLDNIMKEVSRRTCSEIVELPPLVSQVHVGQECLQDKHPSFHDEGKLSQHWTSGFGVGPQVQPQSTVESDPPSGSNRLDGNYSTGAREPLNSDGFIDKDDKSNCEFDLEEFRNLLLTLRDGEPLETLPHNPYLGSIQGVHFAEYSNKIPGFNRGEAQLWC